MDNLDDIKKRLTIGLEVTPQETSSLAVKLSLLWDDKPFSDCVLNLNFVQGQVSITVT
ncbi:MAG TPA: hypothetical protein PKO06_21390 [Candidatus Ozemobacteraceae bacterium]|nr:hypothetical protein [Candidatus Ozemobacteraceae bacterium]